MHFIGIDIGTTSVKAGLFDAAGTQQARWSSAYPTRRGAAGVVEQSPQDWVRLVREALHDLLGRPEGRAVAAIGLCSQVNTHVFADAAGQALAPAIVWQDTRADAESAQLEAQVSIAQKKQWWGAPLPIDASHALSRAAWFRRHHPDAWERTRHVLSPKDYCIRQLTGVAVADPISAIGLVDAQCRYIDELTMLVPGFRQRLPPLKGWTEVAGSFPVESGSGRHIPVVTGTMDAWGSVVGCGAFAEGRGMYVSGTSEILSITARHPPGGPGVITFPEIEGLTVSAGPTQSGADSLRWLSALLGLDKPACLQAAQQAKRRWPTVHFLPHLEGERAPLWDPALSGAFLGLSSSSGPAETALAVLEGVALSARLLLDALTTAAGYRPASLLYGGGGSQSDFWSQLRADALGIPLERVAVQENGCLGAAMLAATGIGAFADAAATSAAMCRVERVFIPDKEQAPRYARMYEVYRQAGDTLKHLGLKRQIALD
jgi:xylulokinase